jgi:ribosomal protein S6--L-glutamate ligase
VNLDIEIWLLTDTRYLRQRMPAALAGWLAGEGTPPVLVVADRGDLVSEPWADLSSGLPPWSGLCAGDLVVARSRHPRALALLERAEAFGARPLDCRSAIEEVRDKARCSAALARRGLPVPETFLVRTPGDLREVAADAFPLLLKPVLGDNGNGLRLVRRPDELADVEWPEEVVLAQRYVDARGIDLKVYVAGEAIWAVRRPSPLTDADDVPQPAEVTPAVRELAEACREEFGLVLFGLDVLELADGSLAIVDVNEFPNYTGVEEAPATIGRLLLEEAARLSRPVGQELVGQR